MRHAGSTTLTARCVGLPRGPKLGPSQASRADAGHPASALSGFSFCVRPLLRKAGRSSAAQALEERDAHGDGDAHHVVAALGAPARRGAARLMEIEGD